MPELFPVWDAPNLVEETQETTVQYGQSYAFDFEKGDFVVEGDGRLRKADGHTAWAQWCIKAVITQRLAYLAYGPGFGADMDTVAAQQTKEAREAEMKLAITEALLADPRTDSVKDFTFSVVGDGILVGFTAVPKIGPEKRLEVSING